LTLSRGRIDESLQSISPSRRIVGQGIGQLGNVWDADRNIDASMRYYAEQLSTSGGDTSRAYEKYHFGPKGGFNQGDADKFSSFEGQYNNQPTAELKRQASGEAAGLEASKYVTDG
jgi:soluble lytic murein transglycosylase-like protein